MRYSILICRIHTFMTPSIYNDDQPIANSYFQEELFLSKLLSTMNVTNYKVSPKHSLSNLRNFLKMFDIIPYISTRGGFYS